MHISPTGDIHMGRDEQLRRLDENAKRMRTAARGYETLVEKIQGLDSQGDIWDAIVEDVSDLLRQRAKRCTSRSDEFIAQMDAYR